MILGGVPVFAASVVSSEERPIKRATIEPKWLLASRTSPKKGSKIYCHSSYGCKEERAWTAKINMQRKGPVDNQFMS